MARTVVGKRIKLLYLDGVQDVPDDTEAQDTLLESHVFQEDVRIIGFSLSAEMILETGAAADDMAQARLALFLSRGAAQDYNARLAVMHLQMRYIVETAGLDMNGQPCDHLEMMFPEGYGIDIDEGSSLYLFETVRNYLGPAVSTRGTCVVYYVER